MRVEQSGQHRRNLLDAVGRSRNAAELGRVAWIAHRHGTEALDAFGDRVDQSELRVSVLVEQEVELVEGRTADIPVTLLVERVKN
jgi:hypothetical protein